MDFILIHYKAIIAVIGSLTGLLALGITFYSKYRDSNIKDQELELKKEQFNLEKKHQISKEKYQELFEQKIDVYKKLYSQINKFRKQLYDVGRYFEGRDEYNEFTMEELTIEDVNITTLKNIFQEIEDNHFAISNKLMESYQDIYDLYKKSTQEFTFMYDVGAIDHEEAKEKWEEIKNKFYEDYKTNIDKFFNQIDLEIKEIKQVLENK